MPDSFVPSVSILQRIVQMRRKEAVDHDPRHTSSDAKDPPVSTWPRIKGADSERSTFSDATAPVAPPRPFLPPSRGSPPR